MRVSHFLVKVSALGVLASPLYALADGPFSGGASNLGIQGSHNKYKLESDIGNFDGVRERVPKAGVFYNYGNKLTGGAGLVYQVGVEAKYGEKSDNKIKEGQADLDLGLRGELQGDNYVDFIVGGGYNWNRLEPEKRNGVEAELTTKTPFAKAAVGYNHKGHNVTTRVEVGTRYSIDGKTKLKVDGLGSSEEVDLKDKINPYAEVTFLWNQGQGALPLTAGLYYSQTNYKLKDRDNVTANTKLKNDEYGFKVGILF